MEVQRRNPIKIVPLRLEAAAPATTPRLTYRGGPLLASPQVFLFFWGDAWMQQPQAALMERMSAFFDYVLTSPLMDQLAEYDVQGYTIGHGTRSGAIAVTVAPPATVTDADVQGFVRDQIASNPAVAEPGPSSLYFVFLPPGVTSQLQGSSSCISYCGYHDDAGGGLCYAVMPYPDCDGCLGGIDAFDALTSTSSHELCEAITDASPGAGWYDDANGEIGDICSWQTKQIGGYTVQLEWSNAQGRCV
jgi:hypothetical protein